MATLTVYSTNGEFIYSQGAVYSTARSGGTFSVFGAGTQITVGQDAGYYCYQGFMDFDTSSLGATASISSAVLSLFLRSDGSVTDFTVTAAYRDWGSSLTSGDFVAGASLSGLTTVATLATSTFTTGQYYSFTDVAMPANVQLTSNTRILLYSSRQSGNNTPSGPEYVGFYGSADPTLKPKLEITYTLGSASPSQTMRMMV